MDDLNFRIEVLKVIEHGTTEDKENLIRMLVGQNLMLKSLLKDSFKDYWKKNR